MPLIPISCHVPLSLVVGVAFAVLSDVPSAPRFLVDVFSFVVHAEFEVGVLAPEEFRWKILLCVLLCIVLIFILSLACYVNLNSNLRSRYNILL